MAKPVKFTAAKKTVTASKPQKLKAANTDFNFGHNVAKKSGRAAQGGGS